MTMLGMNVILIWTVTGIMITTSTIPTIQAMEKSPIHANKSSLGFWRFCKTITPIWLNNSEL